MTVDQRLIGVLLLGLVLGGLITWVVRLCRKISRLELFRRDFVANISHEFRTPLTVIMGYTDTLLEKQLSPETTRNFLGLIGSYARRMFDMVEKVLALSRLENVSPCREMSLVRLPSFFEEIRRGFLPQLEAKQIEWSVLLTPPLGSIETDRGLLEIIINNLVDNAIKYSRAGGAVCIRGERHGRKIRFCVTDLGIGISPEDQGRIFERFYRVSQSAEFASVGTGLGLAIVKHAVQSMGGRIWVESTLGHGASFCFTIG